MTDESIVIVRPKADREQLIRAHEANQASPMNPCDNCSRATSKRYCSKLCEEVGEGRWREPEINYGGSRVGESR